MPWSQAPGRPHIPPGRTVCVECGHGGGLPASFLLKLADRMDTSLALLLDPGAAAASANLTNLLRLREDEEDDGTMSRAK